MMALFSTPVQATSLEYISAAIGRCTAAMMVVWSGEALWATARRKPSSGIQIKPCASGARLRSFRIRISTIKHLSQRFHPRRVPMQRCTRETSLGPRASQLSRRQRTRVPPELPAHWFVSSARWRAAMSSLSDVRGIGAHVTLRPCRRNGRMMFCQQEPSAHAP